LKKSGFIKDKQAVVFSFLKPSPGKVLAVSSANTTGWRFLILEETFAPHLNDPFMKQKNVTG
jgi:hypothetical protein